MTCGKIDEKTLKRSQPGIQIPTKHADNKQNECLRYCRFFQLRPLNYYFEYFLCCFLSTYPFTTNMDNIELIVHIFLPHPQRPLAVIHKISSQRLSSFHFVADIVFCCVKNILNEKFIDKMENGFFPRYGSIFFQIDRDMENGWKR